MSQSDIIQSKLNAFFANNAYNPSQSFECDDLHLPQLIPIKQQRYQFRFNTAKYLTEDNINIPRNKAPVMEVTFDIGRNHRTQHTIEFLDEFRTIKQAIERVENYFNEELPYVERDQLRDADDLLINSSNFYPYRGCALGTHSNLRNVIIFLEYDRTTCHLRIHCE
jgi:hypothetical protein